MKIKAGFLTENKVDVASKLILFILSPFLGFIYSLKRVNTKSSFIIFFLFSLCFGMCFMPMKNPEYIDGMFYQNYFIERTNEIAEPSQAKSCRSQTRYALLHPAPPLPYHIRSEESRSSHTPDFF